MRRSIVLAALVVFVFLLLTWISATVVAPENSPLLQTAETEPNDTFDDANPVSVPVSASSQITPSDDLDFYVMDTDLDREYEASLTIWDNDNQKLRMVLFNARHEYVKTSASSASSTSMVWTANESSHYIRIEVAPVPTGTAHYRLDVSRVPVTPTPTPTPTQEPGTWPLFSLQEDEPNDGFEKANLEIAPGYVMGSIVSLPGDVDHFLIHTRAGVAYEAHLSVYSPEGLELRMGLYSADRAFLRDGSPYAGGSSLGWIASAYYYYIRIEAATSPAALQSAIYSLDLRESRSYSLYLPLVLRYC
jgi:hypothetical protein